MLNNNSGVSVAGPSISRYLLQDVFDVFRDLVLKCLASFRSVVIEQNPTMSEVKGYIVERLRE